MSKQHISCEEVHEHVCENLDEELDSPTCETIRMHINECEECASYLKSLKTTINLYKNYPAPHPSDSTSQHIDEIIRRSRSSDCESS